MRPPFELTSTILDGVAAIERLLGRYEGIQQARATPMLRRLIRVRSVQSSLAIEGDLQQAIESGLLQKSGGRALASYVFPSKIATPKRKK